MIHQYILLVLWFVLLSLPPGFLIFIVLKGGRQGRSDSVLFDSGLKFLETLTLSIVLGLVYLGFMGEIFLLLRTFSLLNYVVSIAVLYMLYVIFLYRNGLIPNIRTYVSRSSETIGRAFSYIKSIKFFHVGLLAVICFAIFSRFHGPISTLTLVAGDNWLSMGLGKMAKSLGYIPPQFLYIHGVGFTSLLGLLYTNELLDPMFITRMLQLLLIQPLIAVIIVLFFKKLGLENKYTFLGAILCLSATQFTLNTNLTHPRGVGYLFPIAILYVWTFYSSSWNGALMLGCLVGGGYIFSPPSILPVLFMLVLIFLNALLNRLRSKTDVNLKNLSIVFVVAFLVISPIITRIITLTPVWTRFTTLVKTPQSMAEIEKINVFTFLFDTFHAIGYYNTGLFVFILAVLGIIFSFRKKHLKHIILYFCVLLFFGFNPYMQIIWGESTDPHRFLGYLFFPEAVLSMSFIQSLLKKGGLRLKVEYEATKTNSFSLWIPKFSVNLLIMVLLCSSIIASTTLAYPGTFAREYAADDADLINAINFIARETHAFPSVRILTYPPANAYSNIYTVSFAYLSPRTVIGDEVFLTGSSNLFYYVQYENIDYLLLSKTDCDAQEFFDNGFNVKTFGNYTVAWVVGASET